MRAPAPTITTILVACLAAFSLSACAPPAPEPSPTPTGFASEEEAFAAAEETYRAYVDALNDVDLADPQTFEPVYALLAGEALDGSKKELTSLHSQGLVKSGPTKLAEFTAIDINEDEGSVEVGVCLDVSEVDIQDAEGASIVPPERKDFQALDVTLASAAGDTDLVITSSAVRDDQSCG